jgi:glycosyltransferase involved in cell wall biosynthesis
MQEDGSYSFVVPAFNEQALIERCLSAIRAEIERSGIDAEIVVVDNGSTDQTGAIAAAVPGVRVVNESVKGLVAARRAGFVASTGSFVANIDADTILPPGWLDIVQREFAAQPRLVALSGPYIYHDATLPIRVATDIFYRYAYCWYLLMRFVFRKGSMIQGGNFVVRREALERAGGFNADFSFYGEDTDLATRLSKVGIVKFSFGLRALSSARRFVAEGLVRVAWHYSMNFIWASFFGRPYTTGWRDFRIDSPGASGSYTR